MELKEISAQEYQNFAEKHDNAYYMNSSYTIDAKKCNDWTVKYLGYFDGDKIVAGIGMYYVPLMRFFKYAYAIRGFLIDYNNEELLSSFTSALKRFLKQEKVTYLRMDPYVTYQVLDIDGNPIEESRNNKPVDNLLKCGYKHLGFSKGLIADTQVRYMMRLDLEGANEETLFNNMHKMNKRNILKAQKAGVEVERVSVDNLDEFMRVMTLTSDKNHLETLSKDSYINQMNNFKDHAYALVSKIDLTKYRNKAQEQLNILEEEYSVLQSKKDTLSAKKFNKREKELKTDIDLEQGKISNAEDIMRNTNQNVLTLSAGYFIDYGNEICYIAGGSDERYSKFCGPFLVQWDMMRLALKENKKYYNFTGTSGDFSQESSDYGVYMFKKRFGGYPFELIGEFQLPINKLVYHLGKILKKIK